MGSSKIKAQGQNRFLLQYMEKLHHSRYFSNGFGITSLSADV